MLYVVGGILLAVAIALMLVFVLTGDTGSQTKTVDLKGSWRVLVYASNNTTQLVENEFMVFDEDTVADYRNGEVYVSSAYSVSGGSMLTLSDISRQYSIEIKTDNHVRLYENATTYMELVRYPDGTTNHTEADQSIVIGKWNVVYRNTDEVIVDEKLVITDATLEDYRNGSSTPAVSTSYSWSENKNMIIDKLATEMQLHVYSEDIIYFVEIGTNCIWVLERAE